MRRLIVPSLVLATFFAGQGIGMASPPTPAFGPAIDPYASYVGQSTCSPTAKPGVVDFKNLLNSTYGSHTWGITRGCSVGGQSEHKEGRALDYSFNVIDPIQRAQADDVLAWLLATDQYGNLHAMARRLGMMYIIWNRQIWAAYNPGAGWQPYNGPSPHTDHIHFSFSWDGAWQRTSWWTAVPNTPEAARDRIHDLSGDRIADLVGITQSGELRYYPNSINANGGVPFNTYTVTGQGWHVLRTVAVGDISGDRVADLVAVTSSGELRYYPNNGSVNGVPFSTYVVTGQGWGAISRLFLADFSGDGYADLVGVTAGGELRYYPNSINANQGVPFNNYVVSGQGWHNLRHIVAGDASGDGIADLVATTTSGELRYYPNNINANQGVPFNNYVVTGQGWSVIDRMWLADISGDRVSDIMAISQSGELRYYPNNGAVNGVPFNSYVVTGQGWGQINRLLVEDISGDRIADIVGTTTTGELRYYPNSINANQGVPFNNYVVTGQGWNAIMSIP